MNPSYLEVERFGDESVLLVAHGYVSMSVLNTLSHLLPVMEQGDGWIRFKEDSNGSLVSEEKTSVAFDDNGTQIPSVRAM